MYGNGNIGKIEVKYSWVPKRNSEGGSAEGSSSAGNPGEGLPQELVLSRSDAVYYYVHDYLGSIAATLDNRGEFVFAEQVYPYGEVKQKYEAGTATQQRFDFTGKERDSETGLHYHGARYYDSKLGIWLSVDPKANKYPGWSPYNYCLNNPLRVVDPDGRIPVDKVVRDSRISSGFGMRMHPKLNTMKMHEGTDLAAPKNKPIHVMADGVITFTGAKPGFGNVVEVDHGKGFKTSYAHISDGAIKVKNGDKVTNDQEIAGVGSTGLSTGNHCHVEVIKNGKKVDPEKVGDLQTVLQPEDETIYMSLPLKEVIITGENKSIPIEVKTK